MNPELDFLEAIAQSASSLGAIATKQKIHSAIEANQAHQNALTAYAQKLSAELDLIDKHLNAVERTDHQGKLKEQPHVLIAGAKKAVAPINLAELAAPNSPFYEDAVRQAEYINAINPRPLKGKEVDALRDAVEADIVRYKVLKAAELGDSTQALEPNYEDLDWESISEKVSDVSSWKRSAEEVRIAWIGNKQPGINHEPWSDAEIEKLKSIIDPKLESNEPVDWVEVSKLLGTNRMPVDCMKHGIERQRFVWDEESYRRLDEAIDIYGIDNWGLVARYVSEDANTTQCQHRYQRAKRKMSSWTKEEDERLLAAVAGYGTSWIDVANVLPGRTNDQCRDRYNDLTAAPSLNESRWDADLDEKLLQAVAKLGNKWKAVATSLESWPNETQCRNRYVKLTKLTRQRVNAQVESSDKPAEVNNQPESEVVASAVPVRRSERMRNRAANPPPPPNADEQNNPEETAAISKKPRGKASTKSSTRRKKLTSG